MEKETSYAVTRLCKNHVRFHQQEKRCLFLIVLLAAINSKIVAATLLSCITASKDL